MSLAEEFDFKVLTDNRFRELVNKICSFIEESKITGAELFWRKVQQLTIVYSDDDIDMCLFALLMAGHYEKCAEQGFYLFKSQETLVLGENYTANNFIKRII